MECLHLLRVEVTSLEVGHQASGAAHNVKNMETHGAQPVGIGPKLVAGDPLRISGQVLAHVLKGVENRRDQGIYSGDRAAQPGLGKVVPSDRNRTRLDSSPL